MNEYTLCERKVTHSSGRESYVPVHGFERMSKASMIDTLKGDKSPVRNFDFYVREATDNNITVTYTQWLQWLGQMIRTPEQMLRSWGVPKR